MNTVKRRAEREADATQGSVFDDLGFSPKKAASLKLKAALHREIVRQAERYSRADLEELFSETQSRVSQLMTGKISGFTLDMLVFYADRLGIRTEFRAKRAPGLTTGIVASKGEVVAVSPARRSTLNSAVPKRHSPVAG